jgi:hypothetical protein
MRTHRSTTAAILLALALCLSACSGGGPGLQGQPPHRGGPRVTYVAADELASSAQDARTGWPDILAQSSLPYWATIYTLDVQSNWVYNVPALASQVKALRPTLVTIDVGLFEAANGVPAWQFSQSLSQLLTELRSAHVQVFVGDVPESLSSSSLVSQYNADIGSDAKATGAHLVNANSAVARSRQRVIVGGILTPVGQQVIASAFATALKRNHA